MSLLIAYLAAEVAPNSTTGIWATVATALVAFLGAATAYLTKKASEAKKEKEQVAEEKVRADQKVEIQAAKLEEARQWQSAAEAAQSASESMREEMHSMDRRVQRVEAENVTLKTKVTDLETEIQHLRRYSAPEAFEKLSGEIHDLKETLLAGQSQTAEILRFLSNLHIQEIGSTPAPR